MRLMTGFVVLCLAITPAIGAKEAPLDPIVQLAAKPKQGAIESGRRSVPIEIKSADGLARYFDEKQVAAITKTVDFKQQVVLIFAWSGSGQDKLTFDVGESDPEIVVFRIKPGRTKDLRPHVHVFALRSNVKWSMK